MSSRTPPKPPPTRPRRGGPAEATDGAAVSVLFPDGAARPDPDAQPDPAVFTDLNLDQVIRAVTRWRDEYDLEPLFRTPVRDAEVIAYRHEVMRDLDDRELTEGVRRFARSMRSVRQYRSLASGISRQHERSVWLLEGARTYVAGVAALAETLGHAELRSRGLRAMREHLVDHVASDGFTSMVADAREVAGLLGGVRYRLHIAERRITVGPDDAGDLDYGQYVEDTFERFRQEPIVERRRERVPTGQLNDVEAEVLERVAQLHPDTFAALDRFCAQHTETLDVTIVTFDREIQFYLAYQEFIRPLQDTGLRFCFPQVDGPAKLVEVRDAFDLALASKLAPRGERIVANDVVLRGAERVIVVSGANQGGKTTFARTVGQVHHLAGIGCPVPAREARLSLPDRLFTHFAKEERLEDHRGRLQDDLIRVHDIFERATGDSVVILNEIFSSTTLEDATLLGSRVLETIRDLDLVAVYVTFIDELASLHPSIVSMVATVDPDDPAIRTFALERRDADGQAFARALAEKHGLTYERLVERLGP